MPYPGKMRAAVEEMFPNLSMEEGMDVLMHRNGKPALVARALNVYEGAVRVWLKDHGWRYDGGIWTKSRKKVTS